MRNLLWCVYLLYILAETTLFMRVFVILAEITLFIVMRVFVILAETILFIQSATKVT